ncbi:MAG: hypothetical protein ACYC9Y_03500 [Candidatus Methylomirabilia bacterium]
MPWRAGVLALASFVLLTGALRAADDRPAAAAVSAQALRELAAMRRLTGCLVAPTDDSGLDLAFHGRPLLEIKGRGSGGETGTLRDLAVFDPAAGRIVSYVCFANASKRTSGEAIVSLAAVSSSADRLVRALLPGSNLGLESVQRYQEGGTESIYYEARYTAVSGEFPFLEPPVRLLLNATSGDFFRLDIDPDWFAPPDLPRVRISRKAAERIATVVLRRGDLAAAFGPGAVFGKTASAEMFTVHPNDSFGFFRENAEERARVAWVVPFRIDGGGAAGLHHLFVDAATGRILGGALGESSARPTR